MNKNLPPVKAPTAKQVRAHVVSNSGYECSAYISNEVNGKLHMIMPAADLWIDINELRETLELLEIQL